jgi:hypothetical protein
VRSGWREEKTHVRLDVLVLQVEGVFPDVDTEDGLVGYSVSTVHRIPKHSKLRTHRPPPVRLFSAAATGDTLLNMQMKLKTHSTKGPGWQ